MAFKRLNIRQHRTATPDTGKTSEANPTVAPAYCLGRFQDVVQGRNLGRAQGCPSFEDMELDVQGGLHRWNL